MSGRPWSQPEVRKMRRRLKMGSSIAEIASMQKRSKTAVIEKLFELTGVRSPEAWQNWAEAMPEHEFLHQPEPVPEKPGKYRAREIIMTEDFSVRSRPILMRQSMEGLPEIFVSLPVFSIQPADWL